MKRIIISFVLYGLIWLIITPSLYAQGILSGTVTSHPDGLPLPGVNVTIKNTTKGTSTDSLGYYEIRNVPEGEVELLFSFLGMRTETRIVNMGPMAHKVVNISMSPDKIMLGAVEVVGIGERKSIGKGEERSIKS